MPMKFFYLICLMAFAQTASSQLVINIISDSSPSCVFCDGFASVSTVTGGTAPYTYAWNTGATTKEIGDLCPGVYIVTVTDAAGITGTATVDMFNQANPPTVFGQVTPVFCFGSNTGSIDLSVSGGINGYYYLWSSGSTTQDLNNLGAGNYCVTVTNFAGCTSSTCFTVVSPSALCVTATPSPASCNGLSNSTIITSIGGGSPGYSYLWSNGSTAPNNGGLTAGTYTTTITDANGCTQTATATITQPSPISATATVQQDPSNPFGSSIYTTVSGGTPGYTYVWSNTSTTANLSNLGPGTYCVTITDANGCTKTTCATVTGGPSTSCVVTAVGTNITPTSLGAIATTISGNAPFFFQWSGPGGYTSIVSNPSNLTLAGTYCVTITTANGCTASTCVTLVSDAPPLFFTTQSNPAGCSNACNGSVTVTIPNGTPPYTYYSTHYNSNGLTEIGTEYQSPFTISGLCAGTIIITVTDESGQSSTKTITILGGSANSTPLNITSSNPAYCNAPGTGTAGSTACEKVCPNTTVVYTAEVLPGCSQPIGGFIWTISGALSYNISANTREVTVLWGGAGSGYVQVTNFGGGGTSACFIGSRCITITDEPVAKFSTNPPISANGTLTVCKGQHVWFDNESLNGEQYEWQFSDDLSNTFVTDAEHTYNIPGIHSVMLIARTECLCADTILLAVEVLNTVSPLLDCVSTICPGEEVTYTTTADCGNYNWNVSPNGTISSGGGSSDNSVTVLWENGPDGIISLEVSACTGSTCPANTVVQVPILSDLAEIEGATRVCPGAEEIYSIEKFKGSNYVWKVKPNTGTILEGQGRDKITVLFKDAPTVDTWVAVEYDNCYLGCKGRDTILIKIRPPFGISGATEKCDGTSTIYAAKQIPGGLPVSCTWQTVRPNGTQAPDILNTATATIAFSAGPGNYQLYAFPDAVGIGNTCSDSAYWKVRAAANPPKLTSISGPSVFCAGKTLTYTANGSSPLNNIIWALKNSNGPEISAEGPAANVEFVSGSPRWVAAHQVSADALGCKSDTIRKLVTELPPFQVTGSLALCPGSVGIYTAPSYVGVEYNWIINPATAGVIKSGQGSNMVEVFWQESGSHTIQAVSCGQNSSVPVTIWPTPVPNPVHPVGLCPGDVATLSSSVAFPSYEWKNVSGAVISTSSTHTVGAGNYALVVTDIHGCVGTSEFSIDQYPNPNVRISTADPTRVCTDLNVQFTALVDEDAEFNFEWFQDGVPLGINNVLYSTTAFGTYAVQATNQFGCSAQEGMTLVKDCSPPPPGGGSCPCTGNGATCPISEINMSITATSRCDSFEFKGVIGPDYMPGSAFWTFRREGIGILGSSISQNTSFVFPNAGLYIAQFNIRKSDGSFCAIADTVPVWVRAQFATVPNCPGSSTAFEDESTFLPGASAQSTWHWDFNDVAQPTLDTSSQINPGWKFNNPVIYNVLLTVTAENGCTSTFNSNVKIPDFPVIQFLPQSLTCAGNANPLSIVETSDYVRMEWNFGDPGSGTLNQTAGTPVYHNYATAGNYAANVTVTNVAGCIASATTVVNITPNNLSGLITPPNTIICEGKFVTLVAPPGGPTATYQWSTGVTTSSIVAFTEGAYDVTITTADGCSYSPPDKKVEINPAPDGEIKSLTYNDLGQITGYVEDYLEVCHGEDIYLEVFDNGSFNYLWSGGLGVGDDQSFTIERGNLLAIGGHQYAVTITNATSGCTTVTSPFDVEVRPVPTGFTATANQFCAGTPSTVSYVGPNNPSWQLIWNNAEVGTSFQTNDPGHFFVRAINEFGCSANSNTITIHPGPNIDAIPGGCHTRCDPDTLCITPMPEIASWQWYFEGNPIPGQTSQQFIANESGTYYVALTDNMGCTAISGDLELTLFTGYGDVLGQVWCDVNDNGVIDAGDTLVSNIPVQIWQSGTIINNGISGVTGGFTFANILATDYVTSVDTGALAPNWQIVIGADDVSLVGCDSKNSVKLLLHFEACAPIAQTINTTACFGTTYDFGGTPILAGTTQVFNYVTSLLCDSTITVNVAALPLASSTLNATACPGGTYTYQGTAINVGASQNFTLPHPITGCDSVVTVNVAALPLASSTLNATACPGGTYTYQGTAINVGASQSFTLLHPVTGCDSVVTVNVAALLIASSTLNATACPGGTYTYQGTAINVGASQNFTLIHPITGCDSVVTVNVAALPIASSILDARVCPGETFMYQNTPVTIGTSQDFTLQHALTGCDSIVTVNVTAFNAFEEIETVTICPGTTYTFDGTTMSPGETRTFEYQTHEGCDSTITISVDAYPALDYNSAAQASCPNIANGNITLSDLAGGTPPFEASINGVDWQNDLIFNELPEGNYTVAVRDDANCLFYDSIQITASLPLGVILTDGILPCDSTAVLLAPVITGDTTGLQFVWSTGAKTPILAVGETGQVSVSVKNKCETVRREAKVVWADSGEWVNIYVPNVFMPASNNPENAVFKPFFFAGMTVLRYEFQVYDRWGNLLYKTTNMNDGWEGSFRSKNIEPGVHVWILEADLSFCGKAVTLRKKGDVTVVR